MKVRDLIEVLRQLPEDYDVRLIADSDDDANIWLHSVECHAQGNSGYELHGEVILLGSE